MLYTPCFDVIVTFIIVVTNQEKISRLLVYFVDSCLHLGHIYYNETRLPFILAKLVIVGVGGGGQC